MDFHELGANFLKANIETLVQWFKFYPQRNCELRVVIVQVWYKNMKIIVLKFLAKMVKNYER